ncbi:hypothetical protein [Anabaena azotica]|uniref:Uncharacterized protein n=1 Tax=Anabaena azotica FACHB-119 TaxID=947527 RepID=A0ABR8D8N3_9NOST|nr:hypothetical protein [Anabaena azotica]MBD2502118.1 hypothetical protein [Anabaena azotica FACHB-119]
MVQSQPDIITTEELRSPTGLARLNLCISQQSHILITIQKILATHPLSVVAHICTLLHICVYTVRVTFPFRRSSDAFGGLRQRRKPPLRLLCAFICVQFESIIKFSQLTIMCLIFA